MVAPTKLQLVLPADLEISPRSRKFYDGTYKWDSDGFTDERGVYCEFDCYNPAARAPTPLPPMFSDDDEDGDHMDIVIKDPIQFPRAESPSPSAITTAIGPNTPFLNLDGNALDSSSHRTPNEIYAFSIGPLVKITPSTTPQRSGLFSGHEDNISLINQLKDTVTSSKPEGADLDIQGKAKLLGAPNSEKEQTNNMEMALTPPRSPMKSTLKAQITSPASTVSTLPRTLSNSSDPDKDMGIKIKGASTVSQNTPPKYTPHSKWKSTTIRGVAQRTQESTKKTPMSKSSLLKRKDGSVEDFTLLELHSGAFMRKGGWRSSARQARSENT